MPPAPPVLLELLEAPEPPALPEPTSGSEEQPRIARKSSGARDRRASIRAWYRGESALDNVA
jgi:hypothetical protein